MNQEFGEGKTRALAKYVNTVAITKRVATDIVETLWGGAPAIEKTKCILLCQTYQLNPLMKHIYLIGYKRYKDKRLVVDDKGEPILDWSIQQGIGATRLLAQRKHNYSYVDMSPRRATQAEIDKVFGDEADTGSLYAFVHLKDNDTGAEVTAVRGIPKDYKVKGLEKGNTLLNQACIWTERQALDRQYPGEMPQDVEIVDERYIEADYKVINEATGEIIEHIAEETEPKQHWCEEHNCAFELKKSRFGAFYAHKLPDGKWCNEKKKKETAPEAQASIEPSEVPAQGTAEEPPAAAAAKPETTKPARDPDTILTINDLQKALFEDFQLQPKQQLAELNLDSWTELAISPAEAYRQIVAVR